MKETNFKQTDIGTIPKDWVVKKFSDIFESVGVRGYQLKTNEYCQSGKTIIIDQGKENIVGYSNKPHPIICHEKGLIIFGDHTRIFKLIKDNFFVGADGVQVLQCIKDNTSFIYYYCLTLDIPNTGYNRHFKYLKDATFILPPTIAEQRAIAEILTTMDEEINMLEEKKAKYQEIKQGMMQQLLTGKIRLID